MPCNPRTFPLGYCSPHFQLPVKPGRLVQCGSFRFAGQLYDLWFAGGQLHVACWGGQGDSVAWSVGLRAEGVPRGLYEGDYAVASKWIRQAMAAAKAARPRDMATIPELHQDRPALAEFMTSLDGDKGGQREPSAIMICCTPDGVRAGLKDDDCGGWCWREGATLAAALDAIEKALQAGAGAFRAGAGKAKRRS